MAYKDIVNINITRQTTSVSVAAFNVPLILSTFASGASGTPSTFTRAKSYGSPMAGAPPAPYTRWLTLSSRRTRP